MTFSIVAHDRATNAWGVAVASKFVAAGSVVPFAEVGGAIATQSYANLAYRPDGLALLAQGISADDAVEQLTQPDPERELRQLGIADAGGTAATFTGSECFDWAGGIVGDGYCCQGNILTGADVIEAMAATFEATDGDLGRRLTHALLADDAKGGDRRGRQAATVLVAQADAGYGAGSDIAIDLRVDDHPQAATELLRLLELHELVFPRPGSLVFEPITDDLANEIRTALDQLGFEVEACGAYDEPLGRALSDWVGVENLESRWSDQPLIEALVLAELRRAASAKY